MAAGRRRSPVPIFVKVAPDLTEAALEEVVQVSTDAGAEGLIATNTTLSRDGISADQPLAAEAGAASPVFGETPIRYHPTRPRAVARLRSNRLNAPRCRSRRRRRRGS